MLVHAQYSCGWTISERGEPHQHRLGSSGRPHDHPQPRGRERGIPPAIRSRTRARGVGRESVHLNRLMAEA